MDRHIQMWPIFFHSARSTAIKPYIPFEKSSFVVNGGSKHESAQDKTYNL
jgi:hypothetical protein